MRSLEVAEVFDAACGVCILSRWVPGGMLMRIVGAV